MSDEEQSHLDRAIGISAGWKKEYLGMKALAERNAKKLRIARSCLVTYASSVAGENMAKKALREMEEVK